jgi:class 3 adenylate cyclase/tetratricopeptide (TPR) repeat protein
MRCSKCGVENPDRAKFCVECASPFARRCPSCNAENPQTAKFCLECAKPLEGAGGESQRVPDPGSPIQVSTGTADSLDGERKVVTFLFADIKGSMDLMEDLDPEEARAVVDPALKLMMEAVHHYGGYVAQPTGDGIFALFGAPVAHEDHPQRALFAALRLQEEMRRYSAKLRVSGNLPVEARVGVNTGEVVVRSIATSQGNVEYAPIGHSTGLAARMQALAPSGSIAATDQIRKLCEGYFVFKSLGPTKVKGVSEPLNVYEVTGLGPLRTRLQRAAIRGYTKFVGREREIEALKHAAELAKGGRRGQIVAVVADPGVGKSRLFFEYKVTSQSGWLVLEALSVSHGKATAYLPLIDLLHFYFRIAPEDDARTRREKVAGKIAMLDRSLEQETLPQLFALLGIVEGEDPFAQMDAQVRRRRTQDAVKRVLLRESLNQPLMLIFEDLHWIDEETQGFLNLLAEAMANAPVLLLVNYRPEYSHQWHSKTYYTQLRLDPLGRDSAEEMLSAVLGDGAELAPLRRIIIEKTEGNPLFIEEIFQALLEDGSLKRNGEVRLVRPVEQLRIPPTVQDILASRIDRLPPEGKDLLQTLAVVGTEFSLPLAREVLRLPPEQLDRLLGGLQTGEFIYEQPAPVDIEYRFKHALTRDMTYKSLLTDRRKSLHERTARAIEALYNDRLEKHLPELANHYKQSRNIDKAVHFLRLAADQAAGRSAMAEAESYLHDAIRLLSTLPGSLTRDAIELGLQTTLGKLLSCKGFGARERDEPMKRAYELCQSVADVEAVLPALFQLVQFYIGRMRLGEACELAAEALEKASQTHDRLFNATAHHNVGEASFWSGELKKSKEHLNSARELFDQVSTDAVVRTHGLDWWILSVSFLAVIDVILGKPALGISWGNRLISRALASPHPYSKAFGLVPATFSWAVMGAWPQVSEMLSLINPTCEELGYQEGAAVTKLFGGGADFWCGKKEQGLAQITEAIGELNSGGNLLFSVWAFVLLSEAQIGVENYEAAGASIAEGLKNLEWTKALWCQAEVYRVAGELERQRPGGDRGAAEKHYRNAIEIARQRSFKWWELRATTGLARLLRDTNRRDEARPMLTEIYNWFTEGDTPNLKDAKALLDELKS